MPIMPLEEPPDFSETERHLIPFWAAVKFLRRRGLIQRWEVKLLRSSLPWGRPMPQALWPMLEQIYFLQVQPPTNSLH